jgi:hypothetical protein
MDAPAPVLDEALLDELARVYMRAALDELMRELASDQARTEAGAPGAARESA